MTDPVLLKAIDVALKASDFSTISSSFCPLSATAIYVPFFSSCYAFISARLYNPFSPIVVSYFLARTTRQLSILGIFSLTLGKWKV
jgi:hypothetical protein